MKKTSTPTPEAIHPVDALFLVTSKMSFLIDAFTQPSPIPFEFSEDAEFGLSTYLREIHAELKRISGQLEHQKEVRS